MSDIPENKWPDDSDGFEVIGEIEAEGGLIRLAVGKDKEGTISLEVKDYGEQYACVLLFDSAVAEFLEHLGKAMTTSLSRR